MGEAVMDIGTEINILPTFHQRRMVSIIPGGKIGQKRNKGSSILLPGMSFVGLVF